MRNSLSLKGISLSRCYIGHNNKSTFNYDLDDLWDSREDGNTIYEDAVGVCGHYTQMTWADLSGNFNGNKLYPTGIPCSDGLCSGYQSPDCPNNNNDMNNFHVKIVKKHVMVVHQL